MKRLLATCTFACLALIMQRPALAASDAFAFAFIAHPFGDALADQSDLQRALDDTDQENLAFVVVGGIKSAIEPCSDRLYEQRKSILENAQNGVMVTLAANDWSDCRYRNGRLAAQERLIRLRELFFADDLSFGASKLPIIRQSANAKFRDYAENARWEVGDIMFATINLPANNNRYLSAAGRNNEFEDRLIANRDWLQRVVMYAKRKKHRGIVIFSDGNPFAQHSQPTGQRDGFKEVRQQLSALAAKFPGRILVIHNQLPSTKTDTPTIRWKQNMGQLGLSSGWVGIQVHGGGKNLFTVRTGSSANVERMKK